ncbi:hypothetical protein [Rhizobium sp. CIAT894]|uniref:hypothetical protein n=1 Tax=Rhizobium sp. CIAT894 TaxID=2020312 RepID=UPI000A1DA6A6|nr:hypothetical protein [Rhizobium sp. CIAT894]
MLDVRLRLIVSVACFATIFHVAAAQETLLQPIWSAPVSARYLAAVDNSAGFAAQSNEFGRLDSFSLPVIGLQDGFASGTPDPALTDAFIGKASQAAPDEKWWPSCAGPVPKPQLARDDTGTWYAGTYDFGCVQVTIMGDRSTSKPTSTQFSDELSEPRVDPSSPADESGDPDDVYSVVLDSLQFGVPYTLTIDCDDSSKDLCRNRQDQLTLLSRFTIRAGKP